MKDEPEQIDDLTTRFLHTMVLVRAQVGVEDETLFMRQLRPHIDAMVASSDVRLSMEELVKRVLADRVAPVFFREAVSALVHCDRREGRSESEEARARL